MKPILFDREGRIYHPKRKEQFRCTYCGFTGTVKEMVDHKKKIGRELSALLEKHSSAGV
jgi:5-methylcytosine-specific restriction endonuclease McrA